MPVEDKSRVVGRVSDFKELESKIVEVDGKKIGVVMCGGNYYAYRDKCPHQGGPACEGEVRPSVVGVKGPGGEYSEEESKDRLSIVCPWHGVEYDLETGVCKTDARVRLKSYSVFVQGDEVRVRV